jgi:hypothetical protein
MIYGAAQQPHAASGEVNKVHAPNCSAGIGISDYAPQGWRAVADAGRSAALSACWKGLGGVPTDLAVSALREEAPLRFRESPCRL